MEARVLLGPPGPRSESVQTAEEQLGDGWMRGACEESWLAPRSRHLLFCFAEFAGVSPAGLCNWETGKLRSCSLVRCLACDATIRQ